MNINKKTSAYLYAATLIFAILMSGWILPAAGINSTVVSAQNKFEDQQFETKPENLGNTAYFEENKGQFDKRVKYFARGTNGFSLFLTGTEAVYVLQEITKSTPEETVSKFGQETRESARGTAVFMKLVGARENSNPVGLEELAHKTNYFKGAESDWRTGISNYRQVRMENVYQDVDAVWKGRENGGVQYDFVVAPNADATQIEWEIAGAKSIEIDEAGNLLIKTEFGVIEQQKPFTYQETNGLKQEVESHFVIENDDRMKVRFNVGNYDRTKSLTIDPSVNLSNLSYATLLGGGGDDTGNAIAVDSAGNTYITGKTTSILFPTTPGTYDTTKNNGSDAFVTKLNANGTDLIYSTFLGGGQDDTATAIAVDATGNAYITGLTFDTLFDYPTTVGAFDTTHNGNFDAFATKLSADGSALIFSTFLGGDSTDEGYGIALDVAGNAYITGTTLDGTIDYPVTFGAFDSTHNGIYDAFVTKLNTDGSALVYSTYIGGSVNDKSYAITADTSGNVYITGSTISGGTPYPTTGGAYDTTHNGNLDVFVTKINATGSALAYSTFLGGDNADEGFGIAIDAAGSAYVTGKTTDGTVDFPVVGAYESIHNGLTDAFAAKLHPSGMFLNYSTFLGGDSLDEGRAIVADASGNAFITGRTFDGTSDFPRSPGAFNTTHNGSYDAFVTKLNASGSWIDYSSFLGSNAEDSGNGIAIDSMGNTFVTGDMSIYVTYNFPTTEGAFDTTFNGGSTDAYVAKFGDFSISGKTLDYDGNPIPNVRIALSGSSSGFVLSDAAGFFTFADTTIGNFAVSATRPFYQFNPGTFQFALLLSNQNLTFVGQPVSGGPSAASAPISGKVESTVGNIGLPNTRLTLIDTVSNNVTVVTTDENGDYEFDSVLTGAFYLVVPDREGYNFTPGIQPISHFDANLHVDFTATPTSPRPVQDFDGDGKSDLAVFRPGEGNWYILQSQNNSLKVVNFGLNGDIPIAADYDGDDRADIAVYRPGEGNWYRLNSSNGAFSAIHFGAAEDKPVPADFDGDGKTDIAVFRPSSGVWHRLNSFDGSYQAVKFGISEDKPVPADFDGDGKSDLVVFRPSSGVWYRLNSSDGNYVAYQFGLPEDIPMAADFDGDGKPDTAVYRPSSGVWYSLDSADNEFRAVQFGISSDTPVPADYNGDGRIEHAVYRSGTWYQLFSDGNSASSRFGLQTDIPVAGIR